MEAGATGESESIGRKSLEETDGDGAGGELTVARESDGRRMPNSTGASASISVVVNAAAVAGAGTMSS